MDNENAQQQPTPLSEEQLQQIRERIDSHMAAHFKQEPARSLQAEYCEDVPTLLAEVERLRSVVAELRSEAIDLRLTIQDAYWKWEHGTGLDGEWARQAREALSGEDEEESEGSTDGN